MSCVNKHCEACDREARDREALLTAEHANALLNVEEYKTERDELVVKLGEANKRNGALLHERDQLSTRAEALEVSHKLLARSDKFMPIVGILCDGCEAVLGLVGMRLVPSDKLALAMEPVAIALGWAKVDDKHHCPACKGERT